jgi:isopropylmalate/homocitrate/citramalate synthase
MVTILDTTLREGELHPGILYTHEKRLAIAEALADIGVSRIEFPLVHPQRGGRISEINEAITLVQNYGATAILQFRAYRPDLELATQFNARGAGVFLAISEEQKAKIGNLTDEECVERLRDSLFFLKDHGFKYRRAVLEDAGRYFTKVTSPKNTLERFHRYVKSVEDAGATVISVPDTSGLLTSEQAKDLIRSVRTAVRVEVEIAGHFHNDYGNSLGNALAVTTGADHTRVDEIHTSISGIGARNGITDFYELVANLEDNFGIRTGIRREGLRQLYDFYKDIMRDHYTARDCLAPQVAVEQAGTHQAQQLRDPGGYIPPLKLKHDIREIKFAASNIMSRHVMDEVMNEYNLEEAAIIAITNTIAERSVFHSRTVSPPEVQDIIESITGVRVPSEAIGKIVYGGREHVYIHINVRPQCPAREIIDELYHWPEVVRIDEVYGDIDIVVLAATRDRQGNYTVDKIRERFKDAILKTNTLTIE